VNIEVKEILDDRQVEISIRKTDEKSEDEDIVINLEKIIDETHNVVRKPYLGVVVDEVTADISGNTDPTITGVVVAKVVKESAAEKAGLKEGDLITKVNDTEITDGHRFLKTIVSFEPGDEITIYFERDGRENSVAAKLGEKKTSAWHVPTGRDFDWHGKIYKQFQHEALKDRPFLGVYPGAVSEDGVEQEGVTIGDVIEKSTAEEIGLKKGDVIIEVNDKPVITFDELRKVISDAKVGDAIKVEWKRDGQKMKARVPLKSKADYKELWHRFHNDVIAHCGDARINKFKYHLNGNTEMSKEIIEKTIERLEGKIEHLKEQLQQLSINGEGAGTKTEETKVTITIEDVSKNNLSVDNLFFSPNPNSGKFALSFELPGTGETVVRIFDVNNKEIYSETLGKFSGRYDGQIDVSENPKGIYFLQITQDNKVLNKKIVIQ